MDNEDIPIFVPTSDNAYMSITRIENQVAGLSLLPSNGGAVGVLRMSAPAVAQDVAAA